MSDVAILSIKPIYANQILAGEKTIELRRSAMGLNPGDILLIYFSAPEQHLGMWLRIGHIETLPVDEMWRRYKDRLGISHDDYLAYFAGKNSSTGLHIADVHQLNPEIPLTELQRLVPGFVPPQGILRLRRAFGRYEKLISKLPTPLPTDALRQQVLPL